MKFLNCEMEFVCPKDWEGMIVSADPNIRHCSTCNKDVHFCHTVEDLKKAIDAQHCVTYISGGVAGDPKVLEALILDLDDRKRSELRVPRVIRTTGIPRGYKGAQSLLESDDEKDL